MKRHLLPAFLDRLVEEEIDDRPVPVLGLGDQDAAVALLAATRSVLWATTEQEIITAVARFGLSLGGRLVPAADDEGSGIPLDIALGVGPPLLFDADALSITRMRLEQLLPVLIEDARTAIIRLRHLDDVQTASGTDPLTGLLSRRELMRQLPGLQVGDVVCLLDIDYFRAVNERLGHIGGDLVLRDLGRLIVANIRGSDRAGRYGGDEIVILFKDVPEPVALGRLELLQQLWAQLPSQTVTFSAGACSLDARGWQSALENADAAMYLAKNEGRNRSTGQGAHS